MTDDRALTRAEALLVDLAVMIVAGAQLEPRRDWAEVLARHLQAAPEVAPRLKPVRRALDRLCEDWFRGADDFRTRFDLAVAVRRFFEARYCRATAPPADAAAA